MNHKLSLVFLILFAAPLWALNPTESEVGPVTDIASLTPDDADLNDFVWKNRPIVVFADSPEDPRFVQQMAYLNDRALDLLLRDVVVLTDTDPSIDSALRDRLHPRGFMLVLLAKDGSIVLRKPFPWTVREITRAIDKLPLRQQEIRDRRSGTLR